MQKSQELQIKTEGTENLDKGVMNFPSLESIKTSHYLKIKSGECDHTLFVRIIVVNIFGETGLQVSIYSPRHNIITYESIEDKKLIMLILNLLSLNNSKLKKLKFHNIIQMQSRMHGFIYTFVSNKKKEKEFGTMKKTLIFSNELSVKSHLIKNSEDLQLKFRTKLLHFLIKLPKIGKATIAMTIYFCDEFSEAFQEYSIMMCFQIIYYNSRTKALKLILNRDDLHELFQMDLDKVTTTVDFLNKVRYLLQKITFVRQKLYSSPQFVPKFTPTQGPNLDLLKERTLIVRKPNGKKQQVELESLRWFRNNFAKHELGKTQTNVSKSFLEQYIQDTRIIGQFIKKIKTEFVLITVCKHMILDYWILYSYIPKTSRYFVCYITNSDLLYMDFKDIAEIYPTQVYSECMNGSSKRTFVDYKAFYKKYRQSNLVPEGDLEGTSHERKTSFQLNQLAQYNQNGDVNENQELEIGKIIDSFKNKKMRKVMRIKTITDLTEKLNVAVRKGLTFERYQNLYNYIEFYVWENFAKKIELKSLDDNTSWLFAIKKFKVQLKQVLFTNYVKIDKQHDAHIEIFILLNREKERGKEINTERDAPEKEKSKEMQKEKDKEKDHFSLADSKKTDKSSMETEKTEKERENYQMKERKTKFKREEFDFEKNVENRPPRKTKFKREFENEGIDNEKNVENKEVRDKKKTKFKRDLENEKEAENEKSEKVEKHQKIETSEKLEGSEKIVADDFSEKNKENQGSTDKEEKEKEKETLFSPFEPIGYAATYNHNILIRYLSLNKLSIQFEKINLREIINLFIADGFYKFQTNYMNSKFYLSDLQNLCNFIIYKIKSSNFANLIHDNTSKKKHHASKNSQYFRRMAENDDGSDAPVVKQIFNRKPMQIITFRFYLEERILSAIIYKRSSCQCITREYKFDALKDIIVFFDQMLENKMYKEICDRLLLVIKNILSIDVNFEFMLLDKNDD